MATSNSKEPWTLEEAKAHLPQILRLAEVDGPQYICAEPSAGQDSAPRKTFVIMPAEAPQAKKLPEKRLGKWLVENTPRGTNLKVPEYDESGRFIAFSDVIFDDEE